MEEQRIREIVREELTESNRKLIAQMAGHLADGIARIYEKKPTEIVTNCSISVGLPMEPGELDKILKSAESVCLGEFKGNAAPLAQPIKSCTF